MILKIISEIPAEPGIGINDEVIWWYAHKNTESKNEVTSTWPVVGNPDISFIPKPSNATPAIKGIEYFKVIIMKQTIKVKMNTARLENNLFNSIRKFSTLTRTFSLNSSGFLMI